MVDGVNLTDALAILRTLYLPPQRRMALIAQALTVADDPTELRRHVYIATAEAERVREAIQAQYSAELDRRRAWTQSIATEAHRAASGATAVPAAHRRPVPMDEATPIHRPVTVRFVEPTKPNAIPAPRPEQSDGQERTRAQRFECPPDHKHAGSRTCYSGHKCRCEPCRKSHGRAMAAYKLKRGYKN